jgi:hypothetical protein
MQLICTQLTPVSILVETNYPSQETERMSITRKGTCILSHYSKSLLKTMESFQKSILYTQKIQKSGVDHQGSFYTRKSTTCIPPIVMLQIGTGLIS